ncbi:MAG: ABC transporter permease [Bacteroidetes bacterium]|nr:ABC transporter permease [Bacteroidota bacterium]
MKRILATYIKEWHLMRRDLGGFALLFLMPILLIIIMALVQDGPFKDYKDRKFETLFLNLDQGKVAASIKKSLIASEQFTIIETLNGKPLEEAHVVKAIQAGKYQFAIIMKKGISAEIVNSGNIIANQIGKKIGINAQLPHRESRDSIAIELMFDPVSKPAMKIAITNAVERFMQKVQSEIVLDRIASLSPNTEKDTSFDFEKILHQVGVKEVSSQPKNEMQSKMNSVQHNVPAWAIFGMFFMIIIISESIINERLSGSWTRIKLIPGNFSHILMGKLMFFVLLGIVQFYLMLLVGVYVMPLIGLDALQLSDSPLLLFILVSSISCCATAYGILIGILFNSSNQALPVAAISVVILSAIGGVWVPIEVLPNVLKSISLISPMRWGLEGINNVLLRQCSFTDIIKPCVVLLSGSAITLSLAWLIEKKK